jgi:hypothetical protein
LGAFCPQTPHKFLLCVSQEAALHFSYITIVSLGDKFATYRILTSEDVKGVQGQKAPAYFFLKIIKY